MIKNILLSLKEDGFIKTLNKINREICNRTRNYKNKLIYSIYRIRHKDGYLLKNVQGSLMRLDLDDVGISKELTLTGIHEKNSTKYFKKTIKTGMHIAEIGANIGYYALIASRIIGKNGLIYAFEPSLKNYNSLKENIELNRVESLFNLYNLGVGAENTQGDFYISSKGNMSSFINREATGDIRILETVKVDIVAADSFFENKTVDYLRMDVEGFEIEIIKGMHNILTGNNKPQGMFIEVHSELLHKRNTCGKDFILTLKSYGYEVEKSFWRGKESISVNNTNDLLGHELLEKGYWETFFKLV